MMSSSRQDTSPSVNRIVQHPSGLLVVVGGDAGGENTCGQVMNRRIDPELFAIAQEAHQHMVDVCERVRTMATPTIEQSIHKRVLLYETVLLNDAIGTVILLASHDGLRMTLPITRMAHEYVTRAIYYAQRKTIAFKHIRGIWPHMDRLFAGGVETDMANPEVRAEIDRSVAQFMADHPEWTRPHDATLQPILIEMHGERRGQRLYDRWHKFPSPFVHGTFDGVGMVLGHDGHNTIVRPGADIANTMLAEHSRFAFSMTALHKREFGITDASTLPLFRRYLKRLHQLRIRVSSPFPLPRASFRAKK